MKVFLFHLSAWLKVWVCEWAGSFQKLLHMIPPAFPVATNVPVSSICSHAGHKTHQKNTELVQLLK